MGKATSGAWQCRGPRYHGYSKRHHDSHCEENAMIRRVVAKSGEGIHKQMVSDLMIYVVVVRNG